MTLAPIDRPPKQRTFSVYDLEWIPHTLEVRVIGTYDGEQYRSFYEMGDFLNFALSTSNRGRWFYAHAGGLYDVQFVLDYILKHKMGEYEVDAKFSGSSAIIVKIRKGKNCWYFLDSFWLLRASLRDIGAKMVGIAKGGLDPNEGASREQIEAYYRDTPIVELTEYNKTDNEILWKAIAIFQNSLLDLGGQLQMTLASSAMALFRRRFLKQTIKTRAGVNATARGAYIASRVEVLSKTCENANYFDINSSFPYAMTKPAPGHLRSMRRTVPPGENQLYIAKAIITSPERFLPPLPYRTPDHRIYFPTGTWEGQFSNVDLELIEEVGGRIESIEEVLVFEPFLDLADYATTLYEMRRVLDDSDPMRTILKLLLNSLYGKFAEQSEKQSLHVNPPAFFFNDPTIKERDMLMPGVWLAWSESEVEHAHVPLAMHITALARRNLFRFMDKCKETYYCDTDGFACDMETEFETGDSLGALKLEKVLRPEEECFRTFDPKAPEYHDVGSILPGGKHGKGVCSVCSYSLSPGAVFLAPKQYTMHTTHKDAKKRRLVRGKGFSRLTYEQFLKLGEGEDVEIERMVRIRENLRAGRSAPLEKMFPKGMRNSVRPKRCFGADGRSRPWSIDELSIPWEKPGEFLELQEAPTPELGETGSNEWSKFLETDPGGTSD